MQAKFKITEKKEWSAVAILSDPMSITQTAKTWFDGQGGKIEHIRFDSFQIDDVILVEFSLDNGRMIVTHAELAQDTKKTTTQSKTTSNVGWINLNGTRIETATKVLFDALAKQDFAVVAFIGDTGEGKTRRAQALAESIGYQFTKVDCGLWQNPLSPLVTMRAIDGSTVESPSPFIVAIEKDNQVILLDEITRAKNTAPNAILGLLDHTATIEYLGTTVKRGKNIIVVMTANIGSQYVGTTKLDAALVDRINLWVDVTTPPVDLLAEIITEQSGASAENAKKIARLIHDLQGNITMPVSTRTGINIGQFIDSGLSLSEIVKFIIGNKANSDDKITIQNSVKSL